MKHFVLGTRYYFNQLTEYDKQIYRQIYDCWKNGNSIAYVSFPGTDFFLPSGLELHTLVTYIIDENPHLFHLETTHFHYRRLGLHVTIEAENVYTPEEYQRVYTRLLHCVDQIVAKARTYRTDYERFRYLHDLLAHNLRYDMGAPNPKAQREIHTIVGALLNKACVCDGYARAYRLLCDQLHLHCIVAVGDSTALGNEGPHAWNFVKYNDKVYHVDVTWDSCLIEDGCPVTDHYFMRNDAAFSVDHSWDTSMYPPIYEDYPRKEPLISNKWEMERVLCESVQAGQKDILLRLERSFPGMETLERLLQGILKRNPKVFAHVRRYGFVYYETIHYARVQFDN